MDEYFASEKARFKSVTDSIHITFGKRKIMGQNRLDASEWGRGEWLTV